MFSLSRFSAAQTRNQVVGKGKKNTFVVVVEDRLWLLAEDTRLNNPLSIGLFVRWSVTLFFYWGVQAVIRITNPAQMLNIHGNVMLKDHMAK